MEESKAIIEALIFSSDVPLSASRITEIIPDMKVADINQMVKELMNEYEERAGGLFIREIAGGFQFRTGTTMGTWVHKLRKERPSVLTPAAMETLAVIAYRQPVVKSEIDKIRGVDVSGPLRGLLEKKLIRIMGRKDVPGKPIIYGTTKQFLEVFNLKDLSELPTLREFKDLHA